MQRFYVCFIFICYVFLLSAPRTMAQDPPTTANAYLPAGVPNSVAGFQAQVDELVRVGRMHDQVTWRTALDMFALPNSGMWIEANFVSQYSAQLTQDYPKVRDGHLEHISWVLGNNVDAPGFTIKVELSEMPAPPSEAGPESDLPLPSHSLAVQNFRLTPLAESRSMPRSWVTSVVYVDGHFRIVGGTYPFWLEELQGIRRPLPGDFRGSVQSARLLHKVAPKYPKDARKKHVEGVVRLHVIIGKDGLLHDLELISGDSLLVDAAIKAVRQWQYAPMILNGQPVEVQTTIDVIFQLNQ